MLTFRWQQPGKWFPGLKISVVPSQSCFRQADEHSPPGREKYQEFDFENVWINVECDVLMSFSPEMITLILKMCDYYVIADIEDKQD